MPKLITREMLWFVLIAVFFLVGMVFMGNAISSSAEQGHRHELECIQAGGTIEMVVGAGPTCVKK